MKVLVVAEHNNRELSASNYHTVFAASKLGFPVDISIIGYQCQAVANQAAQLEFVNQVWVADHLNFQHQLAENTAAFIADFANSYTHILMPANTFGKNILPRVAALLDTEMASDVIEVIDSSTVVRPIYAGNAYETIQILDEKKLFTIRCSAFLAAKYTADQAPIKVIYQGIDNWQSEFISQQLSPAGRPDLATAKIIVAGGRGLQGVENFKLIEKLADQLGAGVAATRAAVDAGFAPNDYQVGQTGKIVAPELYLAIGISGAIQHIAGMKESKVIVAINNDADAPIFKIADVGLVMDLFTAIEELIKELAK